MKNSFAVVTGASKGIGRAIVEKLCSEGLDVLACARNREEFGPLKEAVSGFPGRLEILSTDMSDKNAIKNFSDTVNGREGALQVLVNNVGVFLPGSIIDEPEGQLEKQIATNLYSAYYLSRGVIDKIPGGGHIFNICSTASLSAYPNGSSYSITKYALLGFSYNLREELKLRGIKVTAVIPGNTLTPSWGNIDVDESRFIRASDIAETIFSVSQLSANTNIEEILIQPQFKQ